MSEMTMEQARAVVERLDRELSDAKARVRELRGSTAKGRPEPKPYGCGCGELTRGGDFLPGHDARFRGQLLKAIDAGDESAITGLLARPTLLHGQTEAELRERLGSETRKKEAQIARRAETQAKRDAPKANPVRPAPKPSQTKSKPRIDTVEAQQGTKSPSVARNAGAIKLAKQRAAA